MLLVVLNKIQLIRKFYVIVCRRFRVQSQTSQYFFKFVLHFFLCCKKCFKICFCKYLLIRLIICTGLTNNSTSTASPCLFQGPPNYRGKDYQILGKDSPHLNFLRYLFLCNTHTLYMRFDQLILVSYTMLKKEFKNSLLSV